MPSANSSVAHYFLLTPFLADLSFQKMKLKLEVNWPTGVRERSMFHMIPPSGGEKNVCLPPPKNKLTVVASRKLEQFLLPFAFSLFLKFSTMIMPHFQKSEENKHVKIYSPHNLYLSL